MTLLESMFFSEESVYNKLFPLFNVVNTCESTNGISILIDISAPCENNDIFLVVQTSIFLSALGFNRHHTCKVLCVEISNISIYWDNHLLLCFILT